MSNTQTWQVGDVTITAIVESRTVLPAGFLFPDATDEALAKIAWLRPDYMNDAGHLWIAIQALAVRTPSLTVVVDTCVGNGRKGRIIPTWNDLQTPFLDDLAKAGVDRNTVDVVLCTHLHSDHVGWNTMQHEGRWVPTFPKARYLIAKDEFDHWSAQGGGEGPAVLADSITPIREAGLLQLIDPRHRICEEVSLIPTPGHTPGHVSVAIESKGRKALITGDFIHHPCQMAHPEWREIADTDTVMSEATRKAMLKDYADQPVLVIGTHFPEPAGGHIRREGPAFRFDKA